VLLDYITGGHRIVVGTPEQVADDLTDWIDRFRTEYESTTFRGQPRPR
jgi:alkanesulfonate monooxygenase SsuD/methylene tetrahydromethanopterin reductase-like flavin-dependent oxidoreductase (luciferase family)